MALPLALLVSAIADGVSHEDRRARLNELRNRLGFEPTHAQRDYRTAVIEAVAMIPDPINREAAWIAFFMLEPGWRRAVPMGPDPDDPSRLPPVGLHSDWTPLLPWIAHVLIPGLHADILTIGPNALARHVVDMATRIRDWWRAEHPDLTAMTWHRAEQGMIAWHETFKVAAFQKPAPPGVPLMRWPDGGTVQRLLTRTQIDGEGMAMGHCVGSHWKDVADGKTAILSYRGPDGVPGVTVEIDLDVAYEEDIELKDVEGPHNNFATQPAGMRMGTFLDALVMGIEGSIEGDRHRLGWAGVPALPHELEALENLRIPIFPEIALRGRHLKALYETMIDFKLPDALREEADEHFSTLENNLERAQHAILDGVAILRAAVEPLLKRWGWSWGFSSTEHDNALVEEGIFDDHGNPAVDLTWELDSGVGEATWWLSAPDDEGISHYLGSGEDPLMLLRQYSILHKVDQIPDREEGIPGIQLIPPADVLLDSKSFQAKHGSGPAIRLKRRRAPRP